MVEAVWEEDVMVAAKQAAATRDEEKTVAVVEKVGTSGGKGEMAAAQVVTVAGAVAAATAPVASAPVVAVALVVASKVKVEEMVAEEVGSTAAEEVAVATP